MAQLSVIPEVSAYRKIGIGVSFRMIQEQWDNFNVQTELL
jgi:hypothetical protein